MPDNPFVGAWKLLSCNAIRRNGCILPIYGNEPIGRLFYDADGNMSVHIMKAGRPNFASASKYKCTHVEMRTAFQGYEAYFSTYTIDNQRGTITHHLLGGLFPNWTNTNQLRYFKFFDNRLILSTEPIERGIFQKTITILVWERLN